VGATEPDPVAVVRAFNAAINARDLDALARLMAADHRFVDTAGSTVAGRAACVDAWRGFFTAYPSYRNRFELVATSGTGSVTATGRSLCVEEPALDGPAEWRAVVVDGLVATWQVCEPRP
jgi:ketosteroid isomerase-like protein